MWRRDPCAGSVYVVTMNVSTVTTSDGTLLSEVRRTIVGAEDVLMCVAFVHHKGLHLLMDELRGAVKARARVRLLVTTVFGSTDAGALGEAQDEGLGVRTLNPAGGRSFHPKLYASTCGDRVQAVIGSANLTAGLAVNLEIGVKLEGSRTDPAIRRALEWGEALWSDARAANWEGGGVADSPLETFPADLLRALEREVRRNPRFETLGQRPAANFVRELVPTGLWVETARSAREGGPVEIPAWMFNLAWEHLRTHGTLSNVVLLNQLRVHRSSAVCAILARLPQVERLPGRGIVLRWRA